MPNPTNRSSVTGARTATWGSSPADVHAPDGSPRTLAGLLVWLLALPTLPLVLVAPTAVAAFTLGAVLTALARRLAARVDTRGRTAPPTPRPSN